MQSFAFIRYGCRRYGDRPAKGGRNRTRNKVAAVNVLDRCYRIYRTFKKTLLEQCS